MNCIKTLPVIFIYSFFIALSFNVSAQPGGLDISFSTRNGFSFETGKNAAVYAMAIQPDGKLITGGQFISFNGEKCNYIARLNADGTLDETFNTGEGFNKPVRTISLQPDGKIIAGGEFTSYNGTEQNYIIRLNADGSKDQSFETGNSFNDIVYSTLVEPDGDILAGGKFTNFNGSWQNYIVRIKPDGKLDLLFYTEKGFNDIVYALALQNDGKVIVAGTFTAFNGNTANRIIRLTAEGEADDSFVSGSGFDNIVRALAIDSKNSIIAGGYFSQYNGKPGNYIARLNSNGSMDDTFKQGSGFNGSVQTVFVQPDGKIVAGGYYTAYNGTERKNISRINADGSIDNTFVPGKGASSGVLSVLYNKKFFIAGAFTTYNDGVANQVCKLLAEPFIVSVSPTNAICAGENLTVEFSSEGTFAEGNIFTVQLSDATGNFANAVNIGALNATTGGVITATVPTSTASGIKYRVRISTGNPAMKSNPNDMDIRINALVTPSVTITNSPAEAVCAGSEIKFNASAQHGGNTPVYQWKVNGNNAGENSSVFVSGTLNNGDNIICTLVSNVSCPAKNNVSSNSIQAKVNPLITPSITISASPGEKVCEHSEVKFNANVVNGGTAPAFVWKKNGESTGINSISYSDFALKNSDVITCMVTSNAQCLSVKEATSNSITMKISSILTPSVKITSDNTGDICQGTMVKFTAEPSNAGVDPLYQWKKNGKNVGTNSSNYSDGALQNGDEISCIITTSAQCFSQKEATSNYIELSVKKCD